MSRGFVPGSAGNFVTVPTIAGRIFDNTPTSSSSVECMRAALRDMKGLT